MLTPGRPHPLPPGPAARRQPLLRGARGAAALVHQVGRHLVLRRHPLHPAVRCATLARAWRLARQGWWLLAWLCMARARSACCARCPLLHCT
jgi:hypothetical protein